ncbi:hypothetical protein AN641_01965 [Candidatus Epulonipiscioides gigas]|nr:hypothetical protein AN641_01965 [Epulopiscium sp. SCG-C07WGA-EpuloA2]
MKKLFIFFSILINLNTIIYATTFDEWQVSLENLSKKTQQNITALEQLQKDILAGVAQDDWETTLYQLEIDTNKNLEELEQIQKMLNDWVVKVEINFDNASGKSITYGGEEAQLNLLTPPYISDKNHTMIGIRDIAYLFDVPDADIAFSMDENNLVSNISIIYNNTITYFALGSNIAYKGTEAILMDAPPIIKNGYTYLPIQDVAEIFDANANLDKKILSISKY